MQCMQLLALILSLCLPTGLTIGLEIISTGPTSIEKASGESVKLEFMFSLSPEDSGPLDIEWSLLSSDNQKEDKVVRANFALKPGLLFRKMEQETLGVFFFSVKSLESFQPGLL